MKNWIDAHCHLADPQWTKQLDAVIQRSLAVGVTGWLQGGVDPADWDRQVEIRQSNGSGVIPCFGLHPWWASSSDAGQIEKAFTELKRRAPMATALGELGLDFSPRFKDPLSMEQQRLAFKRQLTLAKTLGKPLVLHIVQAHAEAIESLRREGPFPAGGIVHGFSASLELAREYLDLGFHLSFGTGVLKPGYRKLKWAIQLVPLDRIVIETDSPDSEGGEPAMLIEVAQGIAAYRTESREEILAHSTANLKKLLGLA